MRVCLAVVALVSVWALSAADAMGVRIRRAQFSVSLAGTYTTSAEVTEAQCGTTGPNGELVDLPPVKTTVSDSTRFSSARHARLIVEEFDRPPLAAGGGGVSVRIRVTRTSNMTRSGHVRGCRPGLDATDPPTHCGTLTRTYSGAYIGANRGSGLGFTFLRQGHFVAFPNDPFGDECSLGPGQVWLGRLSVLTGPVSTAKLFNRRRHTIVVVARRTARSQVREGDQTAVVTLSERYTLTLRRTG
jgi:hypothetical protein